MRCESGVIQVILHTDQVHKNTQPRTSKLPPTNDGNVRSTGALRRHTGFYLRVSGLCTWGVMSAPGDRWEVVMPQVGSTWGCELFCEAPVRPHPPLCAQRGLVYWAHQQGYICTVYRISRAAAGRNQDGAAGWPRRGAWGR